MQIVTSDGVPLWWRTKGDGPVVALLPGPGDSSDVFPRLFRDRLMAAGLAVLRFDPRDTGISGDGGDTYTLATMADDVVTVLDAAGVNSAHLIGLSMGGMVLVDVASRYADRVHSAVFLSAMSPDPAAGMGEDFFAAIGTEPVTATLTAMGSPTESDRTWIVEELAHASRRAPFRPDAGDRHQAAAFRFGWPEHERLAEIGAPALVIHGTEDRVLPLAHASAVDEGIATLALHILDGMGHLPTRAEWDHIADLSIRHVVANH